MRAVVQPGATVRRGDRVAFEPGRDGVFVHTGLAGVVEGVELRPSPVGGALVPAVIVRPTPDDAADVAFTPDVRPDLNRNGGLSVSPSGETAFSSADLSASALIDLARHAGVIGHGGAGFPLHRKLASTLGSRACVNVVANAVECEPPIGCDAHLLARHADEVIDGLHWVSGALGAARTTIVTGPVTFAALQTHPAGRSLHSDPRVEVIETSGEFTFGDERLLLERLFGRASADPQRPSENGYVVVNPGTAFALSRAVRYRLPVVGRYVTLASGGDTATTVWIPTGARIDEVYRAVFPDSDETAFATGGRLMGRSAPRSTPIDAATNCIRPFRVRSSEPGNPKGLAATHAARSQPCIGCGFCDEACPYQLVPQRLLRETQWEQQRQSGQEGAVANVTDAAQGALDRCTTCNECTRACPSNIPLGDVFFQAKVSLAAQRQSRAAAAWAQTRSDEHPARVARRRERFGTRRRRGPSRSPGSAVDSSGSAGLSNELPQTPGPSHPEGSAPPADDVAAALARVRAKHRRRNADPSAP